MPEEKKSQSSDEKLQYLRRGEVRTMGKDVSSLREKDAQQERERVAKIRVQEQAEREKKGEAAAQEEALARREAAEETKKKEEELARLRQERKETEKAQTAKETEKVEEKKEGFKEAMKETQSQEEAERKRFLERVAAKAEGGKESAVPPPPPIRPKPPRPSQPPTPPSPEAQTEKEPPKKASIPKPEIPRPTSSKDEIPGGQAKPEFPKPEPPRPEPPKPSAPPKKPFRPKVPQIPKAGEGVKKVKEYGPRKVLPKRMPLPRGLWAKIVLSLLALAILAAVGTFWYWYFAVKGEEKPREEPREETMPEKPAGETKEPAEEIKESSEETSGPTIIVPEINRMILGFGYHIPESPRTIDTIVIHTVYNALGGDVHSLEGVLDEYEMYGVAAHYLIDREGKVYQTAPKEAIAYHAGLSQMPDGRTSVNDFSIGIEAISHKDGSLTEEQYLALAGLVKQLKEEYQVPDDSIVGHSDIAPERKTDPWNFDWEYFRLLID